MKYPSNNAWYYEQIELGYNYRMTDIQAALGSAQLTKLSDYLDIRHKLAKVYDQSFEDCNLDKPYRNKKNRSSLHLYIIRVCVKYHTQIFKRLRTAGIGVNLHYIPVHTHPYFRKLGFNWGDFPNAENYYSRAISLPIFPTLNLEQQQYTIDQVKKAIDYS